MTGIYGVTERRHMAVVADSIQGTMPAAWKTAAQISDALRRDLPDLDDVVIGRVAYVISVQVATAVAASMILGTPTQTLPSTIAAVLAAAGLQMTETEWKD